MIEVIICGYGYSVSLGGLSVYFDVAEVAEDERSIEFFVFGKSVVAELKGNQFEDARNALIHSGAWV
jgi:hypothetical protein